MVEPHPAASNKEHRVSPVEVEFLSTSTSNMGIIGNPFFPIAGNKAAVSATPVGPPITKNRIERASDNNFSPVSSISAYVASSAASRGGNAGGGG